MRIRDKMKALTRNVVILALAAAEAQSTEIERLLSAAKWGDAEAQFKLGSLYAEGRGADRNYNEALRWYRAAGVQGHAEAQFKLGFMFAEGRDIPRSYGAALSWYELAAKQGHAEAQFKLGSLYYYGRGTSWHYPPAREWYSLAVRQGHAEAQFKLGLMYARGQVFPRNYTEAVTAWNHLREVANSPDWQAALLAVAATWVGVIALPCLTYLIARRKRESAACRLPARGWP